MGEGHERKPTEIQMSNWPPSVPDYAWPDAMLAGHRELSDERAEAVGVGRRTNVVAGDGHSDRPLVAREREHPHVVPARDQRRGQVHELRREVLMDEKSYSEI